MLAVFYYRAAVLQEPVSGGWNMSWTVTNTLVPVRLRTWKYGQKLWNQWVD